MLEHRRIVTKVVWEAYLMAITHNAGTRLSSFARKAAMLSLFSSSFFAYVTPVLAKDEAASAAESSDEIIVTARRRAESLQDVPIAVSVVGGDFLKEQNLNNVPELISFVPAITLRPSGTKDTGLLIRGLGTITTSPGAEPTVSMVLDGVVLARPGQMVADLIDLERIEVLRGPQGTLFGKNASAGVINVITRAPTPEPGGYAEASYYSGDEYRLTGVANGELVPGLLSARLALVAADFRGNVRNITTGSQVNGYNRKGARAKLLFTPSPDIDILFSGDYLKSNATSSGVVYIGTATAAYPSGVVTQSTTLPLILQAQGITASFRNRESASEMNNQFKDEFYGVSAQIDYRFGEYELTSITGYRGWKGSQFVDGDGYSALTARTPFQLVDFGTVDSTQFTQEIRLASPKNVIDYVIGLYYFHSKNDETYRRDVTAIAGAGTTSNFGFNRYSVVSDNYSIFGEANINFTDNFRGIVGGRLVRDELKFVANRTSTSAVAITGVQPAFEGSGSKGVTDFAARVGLAFEASNAFNGYLTYSRGYKGPAFNVFFNMIARDAIALAPETSDNFELGFKTSLIDRKIDLNVALFYDKVQNYQANQPDIVAGAIVTRLINAGEVSTRGIEIDAVARLATNFTLAADYAHVIARIDAFRCPVGAAASCDVNGQPLPFAPRHKLALRASYEANLSARLKLTLNGNFTYQSRQQNSITQTPFTIAPGYGLLGASMTLSDEPSGLDFTLLVKNAGNKFYRSTYSQANGGIFSGLPRDYRRYFGFTVRKSF
ncbi:MAG: TonB-dependent receptor [Novosphingobium sp.]|uniref:TonB-dependent receptor n=2 Tax=Novosphingobium sp. TaxID=1874826 RepID=UPI0022BDFAFC|nr:TonB-dependent receptor [Novosphingobium sp.]MCZ8034219.1 TonB-dependent receptor [Novosphingobium sp.]MCZ8059920.1 TonB-dependent receptor [Novosphingobium sp.]MCZ8245750.1 TonB-dependent receptor [Novosphingobium sp.]